jgi:hypothetical protein
MAVRRFVVVGPPVVMGPFVVMMAVVVVPDPGRLDPRVRGGAPGEHEGDHHHERDRDHAERPDARSHVMAANDYQVVIGRAGPAHDRGSPWWPRGRRQGREPTHLATKFTNT